MQTKNQLDPKVLTTVNSQTWHAIWTHGKCHINFHICSMDSTWNPYENLLISYVWHPYQYNMTLLLG